MTGHAAERPGPGGRFGGLDLPDPGFADDDGTADPAVRAALADRGRGSSRRFLAALADARVLVPVVAVLDTTQERVDGSRGEKDSHMASVSLVGADGRRGLVAFTGVDSLTAWDPGARPVPALAPQVAAAAVEEGADAVLLDVAGPVPTAIEGVALVLLAAGVPPAHADAEVREVVAAAALTVPGVRRLRLDPGEGEADLTVVLDLADGVDAQDTAAVVASALAADATLRARLVEAVAVRVL